MSGRAAIGKNACGSFRQVIDRDHDIRISPQENQRATLAKIRARQKMSTDVHNL
jgi:hypothetical protein